MENSLINTNINTLTIEILILKQQTAQNIIEIGKRLIDVKENLPHGEWGKWLSEKVDFTRQTAHKFMRIAEEYSNVNANLHLGTTKLFALLDLPQEEREEFIQNNPVGKMSTRELQQAIKERDEALKELNFTKSNFEHAVEARNKLREETSVLNKKIDEYKEKLAEAQDSGDTEKIERLQVTLSHTDNELKNAYSKIEDLERRLKEKPIDVTAATIVEKIPEEVEKELNELRQQVGQQGNSTTLKFKVYFDELVNNFKNLLGLLDEMQAADTGVYERYKKATVGLISKMSERL